MGGPGFDTRGDVAHFYDQSPHHPNDLPFYLKRVSEGPRSVLELGCGTGRVTIPLASEVDRIHGIDSSEAMLAVCREKAGLSELAVGRVSLEVGDITRFEAPGPFDLVIAPFRVLQNLDTDAEVDGLFAGIRKHLAPHGRAILNAFHPRMDPVSMRDRWVRPMPELAWRVQTTEGRLECFDWHERMDTDRLVLYPKLIYRLTRPDGSEEEATLSIAMRCWYPDTLLALVADQGFRVTRTWGGYSGEPFGEGTELVVEFDLG